MSASSANFSPADSLLAGTGAGTNANVRAIESFDLTSQTVATQLQKDASGSVVVVDRRLFVMNLVRDHIESIDSLFDGISAIEDSVESAGASLSSVDLDVIIAGVSIEAPQFPLCAQFTARRASLDPSHIAFAAIDTLCKNRAAAEQSGTDQK